MARGGPSAPRGRVTLRRVHELLRQGWPPGLTLLTGDDEYHLDLAQRALLDGLVPEAARGYALTVIGGEGRTGIPDVVAAARSAGMFAPQRVVLVRDVATLEGEPAALEGFAADPPRHSYLIVRAPQLDRRRKLHQALETLGTTLAFGRPRPGPEAESELVEIAKLKGLALGAAATRALAAVCGGDLRRAEQELEKIRLWHGAGDAGKAQAVAALPPTVAGAGLLSGWEMADAVLARDRAAALAALRRLVESGEEPLRLLGGISHRARSMLRAKALIEQEREPPQRAVASAGLWGKAASLLARDLERYTLDELLGFPSRLLAADRAMKSRLLGDDVVLEAAVDGMIGGGTDR